MNARSRRGQPLIALVLVLAGWVGVRAALWDGSVAERTHDGGERATPLAALGAGAKGTGTSASRTAKPAPQSNAPPWPSLVPLAMPDLAVPAPAAPHPMPLLAPPGPAPTVVADTAPGSASDAPRMAAGHQLLWLAGISQLALPPDLTRQLAQRRPPAPLLVAAIAAEKHPSRWSGDGWLLLRRGGNGFNLPGAGLPGANLPNGAYGASQAGAVIRYRLTPSSPHRPAVYLRASSALERPRGEEAALGLSLRPLPKVPVAAMAEARVTRTLTGDIVRPAVALVSEFPPQPLPLGLRAEAYAQAGWVGGKYSTAFADGQARLEKPLIGSGRFELRAGAGAWGGAQRGANRLDVGPTATLALPLGGANGRVSADWRFRVAGDAAPDSGPALTLSAGF